MMKKLFSTIFATLLSLSLILTGFTFTAQADDLITETEKISCNATLDDNFADNRVLVVLTREASLKFNTYTANSFAALGCTRVTDLSTSTGAMAKTAMEQATALLRSGEALTLATPVEHSETISNYKQVLCLELNQASKQNVLDTIEALMKRDDVIYAGPDYVMTVREINEVNATVEEITEAQKRWAADKIDLFDAQMLITNPSTVLVGVVDTGIDGEHPEFSDCINESLCRDFSSGSMVVTGTPTDSYSGGHGTKVAGIIAGGSDIYSVAPNVQIVSLQVLNGGRGYSSNAAAAINYATSVGIDILNMSIGWSSAGAGFLERYDYALETVISIYPGLCVCAAGNDGYDNDVVLDYPSGYYLNNLISVGASNELDTRWYVNDTRASNYGQNSVDVFAPGAYMYVPMTGTDDEGNARYGLFSGTSFAAPVVSGIAALMLSMNPDLETYLLKGALLDSVDSISALSNLCVTGGRVNAYNALLAIHTCQYTYTNLGTQGHSGVCNICGRTYVSEHRWKTIGTLVECYVCHAIGN